MTAEVIDLTAHRASRASCYRKLRDPRLAHQLQLHFIKNKTEVQGRCNCGATFTPRRPELDGSIDAVCAEYHAHVDAVTA